MADGLSAILNKAKAVNMVDGFTIWGNRIMVSHMQFANAMILFLKANRDNILNVDIYVFKSSK